MLLGIVQFQKMSTLSPQKGLEFPGGWEVLNDCAMHQLFTSSVVEDPYILVVVKRLQVAVIGLEQLLADFRRNIRLN